MNQSIAEGMSMFNQLTEGGLENRRYPGIC